MRESPLVSCVWLFLVAEGAKDLMWCFPSRAVLISIIVFTKSILNIRNEGV